MSERLAEALERIADALELAPHVPLLERIADALVLGEKGAAAQEAIDTLSARVLELQRELGELLMARDREKADTTVGDDG